MKRFFLYHVRFGLDAGLLGFMEANPFLHSLRWAIFSSRVTALIGSVFFPQHPHALDSLAASRRKFCWTARARRHAQRQRVHRVNAV